MATPSSSAQAPVMTNSSKGVSFSGMMQVTIASGVTGISGVCSTAPAPCVTMLIGLR